MSIVAVPIENALPLTLSLGGAELLEPFSQCPQFAYQLLPCDGYVVDLLGDAQSITASAPVFGSAYLILEDGRRIVLNPNTTVIITPGELAELIITDSPAAPVPEPALGGILLLICLFLLFRSLLKSAS
jgi:hypothetical protein